MKRSILLLLAAPLMALTACMGSTATAPASAGATPPPTSPAATPTPAPANVETIVAKADDAVDRASAAYLSIEPTIKRLIGYLPSPYAERLAASKRVIEQALAAARIATTAATQLAELRKAETEFRRIETIAGTAAR